MRTSLEIMSCKKKEFFSTSMLCAWYEMMTKFRPIHLKHSLPSRSHQTSFSVLPHVHNPFQPLLKWQWLPKTRNTPCTMNANILSLFKNSKKKAAIIKAIMKTSVLFKLLLWRNSHFSCHFKTKTSSTYKKKNAFYYFQISCFIPETLPFLILKLAKWWLYQILIKYDEKKQVFGNTNIFKGVHGRLI